MGSYTFSSQKLGLDSIANARELGGYVMPDGRVVKRGLLLRGGSLAKATKDDLTALAERYHLAKIFDFRTSMEVKQSPDQEVAGARYLWFPAFDEEKQKMEATSLPNDAYRDLGNWLVKHANMPEVQEVARNMYLSMVTSDFTQVQYAGFLQNIVSTPEGAVYWHCSQGKDRTGIGSAVLLAALGGDRELIMQDYAISAEFYKEELELYFRCIETEEEKAVLRTFISVNCEYFEAALDHIDKEYGSMYNFLTGPLCLMDDDMETLRNRYLE